MKNVMLFILLSVPYFANSQTTYFQQDFNASAVLSNYIGAGTNQFTLLGNSGTPNSGQTAVVAITTDASNTANATNQLQLVRAQGGTNTVGFYTNNLTDINGLILVKFDYNNQAQPASGSGNYATASPATWFQLGAGFANALTIEPATAASTTVYSQLGVYNGGTSGAPTYSFLAVAGGTSSVAYNTPGQIKWVINKTAGALSYISPIDNTSVVTLNANSQDVYITNAGVTTAVFTNQAVLNAANAGTGINNFKGVFTSGNSTQYTDNYLIKTLATDGTATLPVDLTSFTASASASSVNLKWQTASEQNSRSFDVQRSVDGKNFSTIGSEAAAGNSTSIKDYRFADFFPVSGTAYYQLLQIDNDGKTKIYGPVAAKFGLSATNELNVVRTSGSSVKVSVYVSSAQKGTVALYNLSGNRIASVAVNLSNGYNIIDIPTNVANQVLVARVETTSISLSKKFLKN